MKMPFLLLIFFNLAASGFSAAASIPASRKMRFTLIFPLKNRFSGKKVLSD